VLVSGDASLMANEFQQGGTSSNADAALLPVGPAAGSVDEGVLTPGASVDGEDPGERLTPTNFNRENENPAVFKPKYLFFHTQIIGY
jgi:hypothetical protein